MKSLQKSGVFLSFFILCSVAVCSGSPSARLSPDEKIYLQRAEKAAFRGLEKLRDPGTGFPVDLAPVSGTAVMRSSVNVAFNKTSPSRIGLSILSCILAGERGELSSNEARQRVLAMMSMVERLEDHQGFLFSWYYLTGEKGRTPAVRGERTISSFENALLDVSLMIASEAFHNPSLSKRIDAYLAKKNYLFFYNQNLFHRNSGLLNQSFDTVKKKYSDADFSIFSSEGRIPVLVAILKDKVSDSVWRRQERLVRSYETAVKEPIPVLASWTGSLYENLFADEITGGGRGVFPALKENASNYIRIQMDKGKQTSSSGIWGFSSGFLPGEERYETSGISEIAYTKHSSDFVTPYASMLALRYFPRASIENLKKMETLQPKMFHPHFGFLDALDPKSGKMSWFILSTDKAMEFIAAADFLNAEEGKRTVADHFSAYLEQKGWAERARQLFASEERHPSLKNFRKSGSGEVAYQETRRIPLDIMKIHQGMGTFYSPRRAEARLKFLDTFKKGYDKTLRIRYDLLRPEAYSGIYFKLNRVNLSPYQALSFQLKGSKANGYPHLLKVELKSNGQHVQFEKVPVSPEWTHIQIAIPPTDAKVDEVCFVLEDALVGEHRKGEFFLKSLSFNR